MKLIGKEEKIHTELKNDVFSYGRMCAKGICEELRKIRSS